jgi:hypothetical protein
MRKLTAADSVLQLAIFLPSTFKPTTNPSDISLCTNRNSIEVIDEISFDASSQNSFDECLLPSFIADLLDSKKCCEPWCKSKDAKQKLQNLLWNAKSKMRMEQR